jgi:hypothetical protein
MMVRAAHRICGRLAAGVSHDDVGWELRRDGYTGHDAFFVI